MSGPTPWIGLNAQGYPCLPRGFGYDFAGDESNRDSQCRICSAAREVKSLPQVAVEPGLGPG